MAPESMKLSRQTKLERSYRRTIRDLELQVSFLQQMLYDERHGIETVCDDPTCETHALPEPRREEDCGITGGEDLIAEMLK